MLHQRTENLRRVAAVLQHAKKAIRTSLPGPGLPGSRKPRVNRAATFPRWNSVLLATSLVGFRDRPYRLRTAVAENPPSVPWVGGAVENGRSI